MSLSDKSGSMGTVGNVGGTGDVTGICWMTGLNNEEVVHERLDAVKGEGGSVSGSMNPNWPLWGGLGARVNWDRLYERLLRESNDCWMKEVREFSVGDEGAEESMFSVRAVLVKAVLVKAVKTVSVREIKEDITKSHCCHQMEQSHRDL